MKITIENLTGTNVLTDQVLATDLLIAAKTRIINYALALTETTSDEVRKLFQDQLNVSITTHKEISAFMIQKSWYQPFDMKKQFQLDQINAQTALNIE